MNRFLFWSALFLGLTSSFHLIAQEENPPKDWFLKSPSKTDPVLGSGVDAAYEILAGLPHKEVVVAVLDSGTEVDHEDLNTVLWVNEDEIPGNGIDDDKNGYVDDVHGWNFLGGPSGDVEFALLEFTRIYRGYHERFNGRKESSVTSEERGDYAKYLNFKRQYEERLDKARTEAKEYRQIEEFYNICDQALSQYFRGKKYGLQDIANIETNDDFMNAVKEFMVVAIENDFASGFEEGRKHFSTLLDYAYNLNYDDRALIGDDPNNMEERSYGNNHYEGPDAEHGTHVAGIIAADRLNDKGIKGMAEHARIMVVRVVPNGDERDKDVANAIRYAVDNGAQVINMSFGKSYSPQKATVDAAVKYAEEKGVLLVHAAGNDGRDNDRSKNYPNDTYEDGSGVCSSWIEVGASTHLDNKFLPASFSNFGRASVDLFAPGQEIYSTVCDGNYKIHQGTSMAAPMVSGAAALLMSYFPELSATQVKDILMDSAHKKGKKKVYIPGQTRKTKFKKLSVSGGVLNIEGAVQMAREQS